MQCISLLTELKAQSINQIRLYESRFVWLLLTSRALKSKEPLRQICHLPVKQGVSPSIPLSQNDFTRSYLMPPTLMRSDGPPDFATLTCQRSGNWLAAPNRCTALSLWTQPERRCCMSNRHHHPPGRVDARVKASGSPMLLPVINMT